MNRIILFVTAIFLIGLACDESNLLVTSDAPVRVSGIVEARQCVSFTPIEPYAIEYQHYATLRFVRSDGTIFSIRTDDSSMFAVSVDTGTYSVILESGHTFPDTLRDIRLVRDTVLDFLLTIDYLSADTINLQFSYSITGDSLGRAAELQFLSILNVRLGDALQLDGANRVVTELSIIGRVVVNYRTPVREGLQIWSVSQSIRYLTDNGIVTEPAKFSAGPDYFPCLH